MTHYVNTFCIELPEVRFLSVPREALQSPNFDPILSQKFLLPLGSDGASPEKLIRDLWCERYHEMPVQN